MRIFLKSSFLGSEEGTALVVAAFCLFPLILLFALSVDLGSSWILRDRLAHAAEAASTAASLEAARSTRPFADSNPSDPAPDCRVDGPVWTAARDALTRELPGSFFGAQDPQISSLSCLQDDADSPTEFRISLMVLANRETLLIGLVSSSLHSFEVAAGSRVSIEPSRWCSADSNPPCSPPSGISETCSGGIPAADNVCFSSGYACRVNNGTEETPDYTDWLCTR